MRRHVADAIDWYLDLLNRKHVLPVNLASLMRDISAKQIGGPGFRPRPLTAEHFTDAELDAIKALADKSGGNPVNYFSYMRLGKRSIGDQRIAGKALTKYLAPLNTIRTTLGAFSIQDKNGVKSVRDVYDFNTNAGEKAYDHKDGTVSFRDPHSKKVERWPKKVLEAIHSRKSDGAYGIIRQNAANYGHTNHDPDNEKITVDIPMSDIDKRLGGRSGKYDINAVPSDDDFKWNAAKAGLFTGAPVGALLGAVSGAMMLLDKKKRKTWVKTMLTHILGGAAIGAITGGVGGYAISGSALKKFNSNPMNEKTGSDNAEASEPASGKVAGRKERKSGLRPKVIKAIAYAIPVLAAAGAGAAAFSALNKFKNRMLNPEQSLYTMKDVPIDWVDSVEKL